jgi:cytidylate kinase
LGCDIGTVVFPSARLKIFLTATPAARAARRAAQLGVVEPGEMATLAEGLRARDELDSTRAESPLRPAADAVVIDSTELSREDVVEAILNAVTAHGRSE